MSSDSRVNALIESVCTLADEIAEGMQRVGPALQQASSLARTFKTRESRTPETPPRRRKRGPVKPVPTVAVTELDSARAAQQLRRHGVKQ